MPYHSQPPARSASRAQLYIVVSRFSSFEDLGLPPDNFFFDTRNLWSIVTQGPYDWRMFTNPEDADDTLECNPKWVYDVLKKLVTGGIVNREKADDILSELETASKEIELH
ncbi:hypothetical protein H9Q72_008848 [Fusarium xylarioides]|uniref:Uncharacterized protein n=1 Tax=Fusarium xylarioides TaxID=221167 RepID=A0A9P7HNV6_9HYPO|nr:hypothetical protein H9Q72_008848 [Fusarium xylarioides]